MEQHLQGRSKGHKMLLLHKLFSQTLLGYL